MRSAALAMTATFALLNLTSPASAQDGDFDFLEEERSVEQLIPESELMKLVETANQGVADARTRSGSACMGGPSTPFKRTANVAATVEPSAASLEQALEAMDAAMATHSWANDQTKRAFLAERKRASTAAAELRLAIETVIAVDKSDQRPSGGAANSAQGRAAAAARQHCPAEVTQVCVPAKRELQTQYCTAVDALGNLAL